MKGSSHYNFSYNFNDWWAGFGLNLNNWGSGPTYNVSGYSYLKVAYKGMDSGVLEVALKSGNVQTLNVQVGTPNSSYKVVYIPISNFSGINLSAKTELVFSISAVQASNSSVYNHDIRFTNTNGPSYGGQNVDYTSLRTWARHSKMDKGVNMANWLEAYWLIPLMLIQKLTNIIEQWSKIW
jgi:hypothetical protein